MVSAGTGRHESDEGIEGNREALRKAARRTKKD